MFRALVAGWSVRGVLQIRVHHLGHSEKKLAKVDPDDNLVWVRYKKQIETQFQGFGEM